MQLETYKEGIKLYNSQNTSKKQLKENFVIRLTEFNKLWREISKSDMQNPEQHFIVQGVRGSGKTTLLSRIALEVEDDESLASWLIPIVFKEEEYGITSLFTLWERVCEELDESHKNLFTGLLDQVESLEEIDPKQAFNILNSYLCKTEKKIILFIDNLVELFEHFNQKEQDTLREVLITNNNIRLIGGSSISLEAFYDYKAPFYQFFKVITLKGLKKKETTALLQKLSEHNGEEDQQKLNNLLNNEPEKIESIRRLTGGIPRTLVILFNILMDGPKGKTFNLLEETIDQTTPLYKHRMDDLSKQQKPIVNAIALNWDAISTKEIAEKTRLNSKQVSAQLNQLEQQWIIEKIPTNTKNNLYALKERFFNIWYLMRYGRRQDRKKVIWLTRFFEIWCSGDELKHRSKQFIQQLNHDSHPQASLMFANALICSDSLDSEIKQSIFTNMNNFLEQSGNGKLNKELLSISNTKNKLEYDLSELFKLWSIKKNMLGIDLKQKLISLLQESNQDETLALVLSFEDDAASFLQAESLLKPLKTESSQLILAHAYFQKDRYDESEAILTKKVYVNSYPVELLLADIYRMKGDYSSAIKHYLNASDLGAKNQFTALAECYFAIENYELAERYAKLSLEQEEDLFTYEIMIKALLKQRKIEKALSLSLIAINLFPKESFFYNLVSLLYSINEDHENELKYAEIAVKYDTDSSFSYTVLASHYLIKAPAKAIPFLTKLIELEETQYLHQLIEVYIELNDINKVPALLEQAEAAQHLEVYNTAAWQCFENVNFKPQALEFATKALELQPNYESEHTYIAIALWNNKLEQATEQMNLFLAEYSNKLDDSNSDDANNLDTDFIELFTLFLAKGQTHLVDNWLKEFKLTERFKPLYYALMTLMQDKYPNEVLRMGAELKETVNEVLAKIAALAEKYK